MTDLKNTTALVRSILERDSQCRNSDSLLYMRVLATVGNQKGLDINAMSVPYFLLNLHGTEFPPFESVRRARQKVQAKYPELAASDKVNRFRAENEAEFRAYAAGEV